MTTCPFRGDTECLTSECAVFDRENQRCSLPSSTKELRELNNRMENLESHLEDVNEQLYKLVEFNEERY